MPECTFGAVFIPGARTLVRASNLGLHSSIGDDVIERIEWEDEEAVQHLRYVPHAGRRCRVALSLTGMLRFGSPHPPFASVL